MQILQGAKICLAVDSLENPIIDSQIKNNLSFVHSHRIEKIPWPFFILFGATAARCFYVQMPEN